MSISDSFAQTCESLRSQGKNIWVAYSGGVDSHVLLQLAVNLFPSVRAVHVNHGLSPNANSWQEHCSSVCAALGVPLQCIAVNARPGLKQSPEDAARVARRSAWQAMFGAQDVLLLAHHAQDQAETIIFRLFRGAGPHGLSGMQQSAELGTATIFRPLLNISKQQILEYAQTNNLKYISDESNQNNNFDRNYIRNQILPLITQRWPQALTSINRSGLLSKQLLNCIAPEIKLKLKALYGESDKQIEISKLISETQAWQYELLRAWLHEHGIIAEYGQLRIIFNDIISAKQDAMPKLVINNKIIRRAQNRLYITNLEEPIIETYNTVWDFQQPLRIPNGQTYTPEQVTSDETVTEKLRRSTLTVRLGAHGLKAKKIFQQYSIPPWQRLNYPLLYANGRLVGIIGLWLSPRI